MEIKVNDYVRDHINGIGKIIKCYDNELEIAFKRARVKTSVSSYFEFKLNKTNPQIIDLIEVGDVLIIKDFVDEACMIFTDIYLIQNETQLLNIKSDLEKNKNKKLYSIVTKEQFEQMEYKIN